MKNKNVVYLGIGSNLDKNTNIKSCIKFLSASFNKRAYSPIYMSPSFGFKGNNFYNLVVKIETAFSLKKLKSWLMNLEDKHERDRTKPRFSNRTLDIDILLFNDSIINDQGLLIPRPEILTQAYVLKPLVDIAGDEIHPQSLRKLSDHLRDIKHKLKFISLVKSLD